MDNTPNDQLSSLAALAEPGRRALYDFVVAQDGPVSRDQAAEGVGVSRAVAAFHLERLVRLGLLDSEQRRLNGRGGPGAGRPAKLYRRSGRDFAVTVPARAYDLAAELLAEAVERSRLSGKPVDGQLFEVAREHGRALATAVRDRVTGRRGRAAVRAATTEVLSDSGYEPCRDADDVVLRNCPFDALADKHRDLVCHMNLELLSGLTEALDEARMRADLQPHEGMCCVRLRPQR